MVRWLLFILATPAIVDSFFRALLLWSSRRKPRASVVASPVRSCLVVIPSRDEGLHLEGTIQSVLESARESECDIRLAVILDGADAQAEALLSRLSIQPLVKSPAGPTKAAALAWLGSNHAALLASADAVLLLDVGSRLGAHFFEALRWQGDEGAMQAWLRGMGNDAGAAAAASEHVAQTVEDRGRENIGWNVRLRGTGTLLTPAAFLGIIPRLVTQVEDLEASLLLTAEGYKLRMTDERSFVFDDKPGDVASAARQRARWLAGRIELLIKHPHALAKLLRRNFAEGIAFLFEIFGRPLSLTILLRAAAGLSLAIGIARGNGGAAAILSLALCLLSIGIEVVFVSRAGSFGIRSSSSLLVSWLWALVLSPRAIFRWMRARRF